MNSPGEMIVSSIFIFQNMLLLILLLMFDIFSNKVWGHFFYGKLQCCSFNKHFIMELIPHQMHELHLVFGNVNPFMFCEFAL